MLGSSTKASAHWSPLSLSLGVLQRKSEQRGAERTAHGKCQPDPLTGYCVAYNDAGTDQVVHVQLVDSVEDCWAVQLAQPFDRVRLDFARSNGRMLQRSNSNRTIRQPPCISALQLLPYPRATRWDAVPDASPCCIPPVLPPSSLSLAFCTCAISITHAA